jgi:hypothetical protein
MLVELAVRIPAGNGIVVDGDLAKPIGAGGLVLLAHGSGSRRSPRNRAVAAGLCDPGLGTLLWTCSPPTKRPSMPARGSFGSTSACSPAASKPPRRGWPTSPGPAPWRSEASGPAPAPPQRSSRRPAARHASVRSAWRLEIVPDATHLFEEPGCASLDEDYGPVAPEASARRLHDH